MSSQIWDKQSNANIPILLPVSFTWLLSKCFCVFSRIISTECWCCDEAGFRCWPHASPSVGQFSSDKNLNVAFVLGGIHEVWSPTQTCHLCSRQSGETVFLQQMSRRQWEQINDKLAIKYTHQQNPDSDKTEDPGLKPHPHVLANPSTLSLLKPLQLLLSFKAF